MTRPERRGAPRIPSALPLALCDATAEIEAHTKNISASGAYCTLPRFIAPMTRVSIRLEFPGQPKPTRITCQGVVVRVDPPNTNSQQSGYNTAIFFSQLADQERSIIAQYVSQRLQPASPRG